MIASYSHNQAFLSSGRESDMGGLQELIQTLRTVNEDSSIHGCLLFRPCRPISTPRR